MLVCLIPIVCREEGSINTDLGDGHCTYSFGSCSIEAEMGEWQQGETVATMMASLLRWLWCMQAVRLRAKLIAAEGQLSLKANRRSCVKRRPSSRFWHKLVLKKSNIGNCMWKLGLDEQVQYTIRWNWPKMKLWAMVYRTTWSVRCHGCLRVGNVWTFWYAVWWNSNLAISRVCGKNTCCLHWALLTYILMSNTSCKKADSCALSVGESKAIA